MDFQQLMSDYWDKFKRAPPVPLEISSGVDRKAVALLVASALKSGVELTPEAVKHLLPDPRPDGALS